MAISDPLIGTVIDGRYRIDARLASGGMASVYRAMNVRLAKPVAVKLIHAHLAEHDDFTARFIREARAAAALNSPHIVSVYDQGVVAMPEGERAYMVMELVQGPDLRSELRAHGSFTIGEALNLTRQVLKALEVAHAAGIVHRDVKPENIMLSRPIPIPPAEQSDAANLSLGAANAPVKESELEGSAPKPQYLAKVADFGLARAASDASSGHSGQLLGTVAYVAPEIVTRGRSGAPADIYATGVMLYELISGSQPFGGESPVAVAYSHVNEEMPRLSAKASWIPGQIDALIAAFTAKSPESRPADGKVALALLEDTLSQLSPNVLAQRIPMLPAASAAQPTKIVAASKRGAHHEISQSKNEWRGGAAAPSSLSNTDTLPEPSISATTAAVAASDSAETDSFDAHTTAELKPKRSKKPLWIILLILLILGALSAGAYWWFTAGPGLRVEIPQVAEMSAPAAQAKLKSAGFQSKITHEYSDTVAKDLVIATDPKSGTKIHPSQLVTIRVSDGVEYLTVPDVTGMESDAAQGALKESRFVPVLAEDWSQDVPEGSVASQTPAAGESIPHDSEVTIVISKGKEPLTIPEIGEADGAAYEQLLKDTGFEVSRSDEFSDEVAEGNVISVDPAEGTDGFRGDTVTIVISKGPELIVVPNVIGKQQGEAREVLEAAGFKVNVEKYLGGYFGTVRLQSEAAGSKVRKGTTITLTVV